MRDIGGLLSEMRLPGRLMRAYEFIREVLRDYSSDNGSLVAAAVSFYVFLSIVPLLLLGIAIGAYLLGSPGRAEDLLISAVGSYAPSMSSSGGFDLRSVVDQVIAGRGVATGIGLLALLWAGTGAIGNFEKAINMAWNTDSRGFLKQRLLSIVILIVMGALLGLSFFITAGVNAVKSLHIPVLGTTPGDWPFVWMLAGYLLPAVISVLTFTIFYKLVPNTKVEWRVAFVGGVFAGLLWEVAKYGFSYYVTHFANYSAVYGSLAGIILLLVWIYYSSIVTIMGAEVASVYAGRHVHYAGANQSAG